MPKHQKKISQKMLLQSRGWKEVSPGIYIAEEKIQTSLPPSKYIARKINYWDEKFEEVQANFYRIYLEAERPLIFDVDLDKNLSQSELSERESFEVKSFLEN